MCLERDKLTDKDGEIKSVENSPSRVAVRKSLFDKGIRTVSRIPTPRHFSADRIYSNAGRPFTISPSVNISRKKNVATKISARDIDENDRVGSVVKHFEQLNNSSVDKNSNEILDENYSSNTNNAAFPSSSGVNLHSSHSSSSNYNNNRYSRSISPVSKDKSEGLCRAKSPDKNFALKQQDHKKSRVGNIYYFTNEKSINSDNKNASRAKRSLS